MIGICKLCHLEKELIKRSHLFPNFMYKGIGDDKNRMYKISTFKPTNKKSIQSGDYEEYILCQDCDNRKFGKLERYANNFLYSQPYRTNSNSFEQVNNHRISKIWCKNIDYIQFKLFLQSLIWRASISNNPMFRMLKLTNEQEEQLRISLTNNSPLDETDFVCTIITHHVNEDVYTDMVHIIPEINRKIVFFINQFIYTFYLDYIDVPEIDKELNLNRNNEMGIMILPIGEWTRIRGLVTKALVEMSKNQTII